MQSYGILARPLVLFKCCIDKECRFFSYLLSETGLSSWITYFLEKKRDVSIVSTYAPDFAEGGRHKRRHHFFEIFDPYFRNHFYYKIILVIINSVQHIF